MSNDLNGPRAVASRKVVVAAKALVTSIEMSDRLTIAAWQRLAELRAALAVLDEVNSKKS